MAGQLFILAPATEKSKKPKKPPLASTPVAKASGPEPTHQ